MISIILASHIAFARQAQSAQDRSQFIPESQAKELCKALDKATRFIPDKIAVDIGSGPAQTDVVGRLDATSTEHDLHDKTGEEAIIGLRLGESKYWTGGEVLYKPGSFNGSTNIRDIFDWLSNLPAEDLSDLTSPGGLSLSKLSEDQRAKLISEGLGSNKDSADVLNGVGTLSVYPWVTYNSGSASGHGSSLGLLTSFSGSNYKPKTGPPLNVPLNEMTKIGDVYVYKPHSLNKPADSNNQNSQVKLTARNDKGYFTTLWEIEKEIQKKTGERFVLDSRLSRDWVYVRGFEKPEDLESALKYLGTANEPHPEHPNGTMTQASFDKIKSAFMRNWAGTPAGMFLSSLLNGSLTNPTIGNALQNGFQGSPFGSSGDDKSSPITGYGLGLSISVGPSGGSGLTDLSGGKLP